MVVNGTNLCQETFSSSEKLWEVFGRGPSGPRAGRSEDRSECRGVQEDQDLSPHLQRLRHRFAAGSTPVTPGEGDISGTRLPKLAASLASDLQPTWWRLTLHAVEHSSATASQGTSPCPPAPCHGQRFFEAPGSRVAH